MTPAEARILRNLRVFMVEEAAKGETDPKVVPLWPRLIVKNDDCVTLRVRL